MKASKVQPFMVSSELAFLQLPRVVLAPGEVATFIIQPDVRVILRRFEALPCWQVFQGGDAAGRVAGPIEPLVMVIRNGASVPGELRAAWVVERVPFRPPPPRAKRVPKKKRMSVADVSALLVCPVCAADFFVPCCGQKRFSVHAVRRVLAEGLADRVPFEA